MCGRDSDRAFQVRHRALCAERSRIASGGISTLWNSPSSGVFVETTRPASARSSLCGVRQRIVIINTDRSRREPDQIARGRPSVDFLEGVADFLIVAVMRDRGEMRAFERRDFNCVGSSRIPRRVAAKAAAAPAQPIGARRHAIVGRERPRKSGERAVTCALGDALKRSVVTESIRPLRDAGEAGGPCRRRFRRSLSR